MADSGAPARRILVVDDEEYITDLLSTSLRFQGFEVEDRRSGFRSPVEERRRSILSWSCST